MKTTAIKYEASLYGDIEVEESKLFLEVLSDSYGQYAASSSLGDDTTLDSIKQY